MANSNTLPSTILVTGATGFIGAMVAAACQQRGWRVIGLGRTRTSAVTVALDLAHEKSRLLDLLAKWQPDACIHCAGPASVGDSLKDPAGDFANSVIASFNLLDCLRQSVPTCKTVVLSSAAVYGNAQTLPISENAVLAPISPYGYHKCMVEQMGQEFWRVYGLPVVFGRIFSAYGAGLRRQVVWDILQKAQHSRAQGEPFCLSGTGDETRDFIHVSDVARALLCLLDHADMRATAYNIASGLSVTIRTLAQLIVRRMASPSPITFDGQIRPGDPLYWQADVSALAALGFRCEVDLATGLGEYDIGNGQT